MALAAFGGSYLARQWIGETRTAAPVASPAATARVVSLAPSVTEILFALDVGDRVVGVTRFCLFPPEAAARPKAGGYYDPNYEAILALRPDLVVVLDEHAEPRRRLADAGYRVLAVDHKSVQGVVDSIALIAAAVGAEGKGQTLQAGIRRAMHRIQEATADLPPPRVLLVVGRELGTGALRQVYVAGGDRFYDPLIRWAGGRNACGPGWAAYPALGPEGLLAVDPDVIVDLVPPGSAADPLQDWQSLPELRAVREGKVHVCRQDYATVPGPRFVQFLEDLARLLHPDLGEGEP